MKNSKMYVQPSDTETFGQAVLEALSFGVPVVVSKCGALPEICSDFGFYVNQNDPISIANKIQEILMFESSDLEKLKNNSNTVAAYGAAAKGNTLLNYAGIKSDLLPVIYDAAPSKQGKFMPGSHIPIQHPDELMKEPPEYVIVLPWNLGGEISNQLSEIKKRGAKLVSFVPQIQYL
jgi:hypothetical protein